MFIVSLVDIIDLREYNIDINLSNRQKRRLNAGINMDEKIPLISLQRMPLYLNYLKGMSANKKYVSSGHIAKALGLGEVLVRKDLAYTSANGRPRVGYVTVELISAIEDFLCCNGCRNAVIVGYGALGKALLEYGGFIHYGIDIVAAFDNDSQKTGLSPSGKPVYGIDELNKKISAHKAELAVICVPASAAQEVTDKLIGCGIKAILNFAPVTLKVPEGIEVRQIDVAANLAILSSTIGR